MLYRVSKGPVSIQSLRQALRRITDKHAVLRTCLRFDSVSGILTQDVQSNDVQDWFGFDISVINNDDELKMIFNDELTKRTNFDLRNGRVFRCHILRQYSSAVDDDDHLSIDDWIIFNFHHVAFDGESEQIFLEDLQQSYIYAQKLRIHNEQTALQYIDCK